MVIDYGINPNCSESVYRVSRDIVDKIPENIIPKDFLLEYQKSVEGYSQMLPTEDTVCFYYYQTGGGDLCKWLEDNKIPFDAQLPFFGGEEQEKSFEPIGRTPEEEAVSSYGENGEFLRRKPYDS